MDIKGILEVFNSIKKNKSPYNCQRCYDSGNCACSWCYGKGHMGMENIKCLHCKDGQVPCRCQSDKKDKVNENKEVVCKECSADGVIPCQNCKGKDGNFKCKECFGEGELTCPECKGKGYIMENGKVRKIKENYTTTPTIAGGEANFKNPASLTVSTSYDSASNRKTISVSAENEKAEELASILKLSGIINVSAVSDKQLNPQIAVQLPPSSQVPSDPFYGLRESFSDDIMDEYNKEEWEPTEDNLGYDRHEDEDVVPSNNGFCVRCNETPIEGDGFMESGVCYDCYNKVSSKLEDNYPEPDDFEEYNRNEGDDYRDEFNESKLNEASEYYVEFNSPNGYQYLKMSGRLRNFTNKKSEATKFSDQAEAKSNAASLKSTGKYSEVKVVPVLEALSPKRESSGLNGAARGWANSPNEQIAGWRALIDDADGPNKPKEMLNKVKGNDNTMTVVANEKDKPLHENKEVNAIAENLMKKFSKLNENEAAYAAKQLNFKHLADKLREAGFIHNIDKESAIHHSAHIFTRNSGEFISFSKDGKWDWAYHNNEELTEGEGKASLLTLIDNLTPSLEEDEDIPVIDDYETRRAKALDFALSDNEKTGRMFSNLDNDPNPFNDFGKVPKDYKPFGNPMREF